MTQGLPAGLTIRARLLGQAELGRGKMRVGPGSPGLAEQVGGVVRTGAQAQRHDGRHNADPGRERNQRGDVHAHCRAIAAFAKARASSSVSWII